MSCNKSAIMSQWADTIIEIDTGAEVLSGSTRLKAGTAEKLVLNMITTATMVKLGKVYKNYMVDMLTTNHKLRERAKKIVMATTGIAAENQAEALLERAEGSIKLAIVMALTEVEREAAAKLLHDHGGFVSKAVKAMTENQRELGV